MTCIVGLVTPKSVIIGGDSAGVSGYNVIVRSDPKVFRNGPFLIGYTSSFRMGQLLRFRLNVEKQHQDTDDYAYMATTFIDAVRSCLQSYGAMKNDNGVHEGGSFIVGYKGTLYTVDSDFQVGINAEPFAACGCGEEYALGALAALAQMKPLDRVRRALEISAQFSAGVRGPFVIEELSRE